MGGVTRPQVNSFLTQSRQQTDTCTRRNTFLCLVFQARVDEAMAGKGRGFVPGTFGSVAPVLLLPLVQQQVLVAWTLEEAEVAG